MRYEDMQKLGDLSYQMLFVVVKRLVRVGDGPEMLDDWTRCLRRVVLIDQRP